MIALIFLVVVIGLFLAGVWARHRSGREVSSAYRTNLAIMASGAGTAIVGGLMPIYVIVMRAARGGTIGDNLPAGVSEDTLLYLVTTGVIITVVGAVNRYLDHLKSE